MSSTLFESFVSSLRFKQLLTRFNNRKSGRFSPRVFSGAWPVTGKGRDAMRCMRCDDAKCKQKKKQFACPACVEHSPCTDRRWVSAGSCADAEWTRWCSSLPDLLLRGVVEKNLFCIQNFGHTNSRYIARLKTTYSFPVVLRSWNPALCLLPSSFEGAV